MLSFSYQSVDSVDNDQWGGGVGGPGIGHRMSADEVRMQQQTIIAGMTVIVQFRICKCTLCVYIIEQDRGLDQLSLALRRQREVGLAIQDDVEEQNGQSQNTHTHTHTHTHTN